MSEKDQATVLPIAIKRADRELLHEAAQSLGKSDSTFLREAALETARVLLEAGES